MSGSHNPYESPRERAERERERQAAEDIAASQGAEELRWLVQHPLGRRFVWRLLSETRVLQTPFHTSGSVMAFQAGEQNVGLKLLARVMEHAPDAYVVMLKEAEERLARARAAEQDEPPA